MISRRFQRYKKQRETPEPTMPTSSQTVIPSDDEPAKSRAIEDLATGRAILGPPRGRPAKRELPIGLDGRPEIAATDVENMSKYVEDIAAGRAKVIM
jgi:hypothetical protein